MDYKPVDIFPPIGLVKAVKEAWNSLMTIEKSPLRKLDPRVAHMIYQCLAFIWSGVFAVMINSTIAFGISALFHVALIGGIFITAAIMNEADKRPERLNRLLGTQAKVDGYNGRRNGGEHD